MTTTELVKSFINGGRKGQASGGRLEIVHGNTLVNYNTAIAYRDDRNNRIILNYDNYSPTTSKHQNRVIQYAPSNQLYITSHKGLMEYLNGEIGINEFPKPVRTDATNILV